MLYTSITLQLKKKTSQLKNGQRTWTDISPAKMYTRPTSTWKCSMSLVIREMQIKTTSHPTGWPELKRRTITGATGDVVKSEPSHTAGGNSKCSRHFVTQSDSSSNKWTYTLDLLTHRAVIGPSTLRYTSKRNKDKCPHKLMKECS